MKNGGSIVDEKTGSRAWGPEGQRMVDLYNEALEKGYPRKGRCFNGAGMALCMLGRLKEGYECFTNAIYEDIYDVRAHAYPPQPDFRGCFLTDCLGFQPRSWHNRANCAFKMGDLKQAHHDSTKARRASADIPDPSNPGYGRPGNRPRLPAGPRSSLGGSRPHAVRPDNRPDNRPTAGRSSTIEDVRTQALHTTRASFPGVALTDCWITGATE